MDRGEFIKGGYTVEPGQDGSWVVWQGTRADTAYRPAMHGFSSHADLIRWLADEHSVGVGRTSPADFINRLNRAAE